MITKILEYKKILESSISNDQEYFDYVSSFYNVEMIEQIKTGEEMAKMITGSTIKTFKTDGDNLIMRWSEGNDNVVILGAVSKTGKINRNDLTDLNIWINQCCTYIEEYKTIYTSPNELSEPILQKIINKIKAKNIDLNIQKYNAPFEHEKYTWKTYIIKRK